MLNRKTMIEGPVHPRAATRGLVLGGAALAAVAGVIVCIGWATGSPALVRMGITGDNVVRLPTGVCFIIGALAIFCSTRERTAWAAAFALRLACAWAMIGVGLVMVADHVVPDRYFDISWFANPATFRTSFNTALALVALGASLLSPPSGEHRAWGLSSRLRLGSATPAGRVAEGWEWWRCQAFAIAAILVGYVAMLGHAYHAEFLYDLSHEVTMSFPSALVFFVLGLASLLREPDAAIAAEITSGMHGGKLLRWMVSIGAILLPSLGLTRMRLQAADIGLTPELGGAIFTTLTVSILAFSLWLAARRLNYVQSQQLFSQDELRLLNASLEVRVRDRTRDLRMSENHFRLLADTAPALIWMTDAHMKCIYVNRANLDFFGHSPSDSMAGTVTGAIEAGKGTAAGRPLHPDDVEPVSRAVRTAMEQRRPYELQMRARRRDGEYRWLHEHGVPRFTPDGEFVGYIGAGVDVSDLQRTRHELREALDEREGSLRRERSLRRELDHRVRNNLASLLGLVSYYEHASHADSAAAVTKTLREKIRAMKDVHDVIARAGGQSVQLHELVMRLLGAMVPDERHGCLSVESGPPVSIQAQQASALAMILQELTTNSFKHGVLGAGAGRVKFEWAMEESSDGSRVRMEWKETGGFAPAAGGGSPSRRDEPSGVGLRLIEGFARSDLRGDCRVSSDATSWSCTLWALLYTTGKEDSAKGPAKEDLVARREPGNIQAASSAD